MNPLSLCREDHYLPLVEVSSPIKTTRGATYNILLCVFGLTSVLTLPASLSGRPESLSDDLPLVRLSKEWQDVASNSASYGLSSSGIRASPEISSLTLSRSPKTR